MRPGHWYRLKSSTDESNQGWEPVLYNSASELSGGLLGVLEPENIHISNKFSGDTNITGKFQNHQEGSLKKSFRWSAFFFFLIIASDIFIVGLKLKIKE